MTLASSFVLALSLPLAACGGTSVPEESRSSSSSGGGGTSSSSPNGNSAPQDQSGTSDPTSATTATSSGANGSSSSSSGASTSSSSSSGSAGSSGLCGPGLACGGLSTCTDRCYGERCCQLTCWCNGDTDTLKCDLYCQK